MKTVLHWLACHTVLIVLSLFVVVGIVFRGPLFGIWPSAEAVKTETDPVVATVEKAEAVKTEKNIPPKSLPEPIVKKVIPLSEPKFETAEKTALVPEKKIQDKPAPAFRDEPIEIKLQRAPYISQSLSVLKSEAPQALQNQQDYQFRPPEEEPAAVAQTQTDLLQQARKAYWNDELDKARSLYSAYIELNPDNPDGYGELGNLLSTAGELDAAADMYKQAAKLLVWQGKTEQAEKLNEVLNSIEVIQNSTE